MQFYKIKTSSVVKKLCKIIEILLTNFTHAWSVPIKCLSISFDLNSNFVSKNVETIYPLTTIYKQACFQFGILRYELNFKKYRCSKFLHLFVLIEEHLFVLAENNA